MLPQRRCGCPPVNAPDLPPFGVHVPRPSKGRSPERWPIERLDSQSSAWGDTSTMHQGARGPARWPPILLPGVLRLSAICNSGCSRGPRHGRSRTLPLVDGIPSCGSIPYKYLESRYHRQVVGTNGPVLDHREGEIQCELPLRGNNVQRLGRNCVVGAAASEHAGHVVGIRW